MPVQQRRDDSSQWDAHRSARNSHGDRAHESEKENGDDGSRAHARPAGRAVRGLRKADYFSFQDSPPNVTCTPERYVNGRAGYPKASL